jgi:hypothetical protein
MIFLFNLLIGAIIGSGVMFVLSLIVVPTIDWADDDWENFGNQVFTMTLVGFIIGLISGAMVL